MQRGGPSERATGGLSCGDTGPRRPATRAGKAEAGKQASKERETRQRKHEVRKESKGCTVGPSTTSPGLAMQALGTARAADPGLRGQEGQGQG